MVRSWRPIATLFAQDLVLLTVDGQSRKIPLNDLDMKKTLAANHERGVDLVIPKNNGEAYLSF